MKRTVAASASLIVCLLAFVALGRADEPAPTVVKASDTDALKASVDKEIVVEGKIEKAAWSSSGKVMNITFEGVERNDFQVVVFEKNKGKFDKAMNGDAAAALTGATVRVRGKIELYREHPEMKLDDPGQVTINPASTQPTTNPS